ncbi:MAG: hypothetical protein WC375_12870 [Methanomassiliicoccales archaeon]
MMIWKRCSNVVVANISIERGGNRRERPFLPQIVMTKHKKEGLGAHIGVISRALRIFSEHLQGCPR